MNLRTWLYIPLILAVTASSPVLAAGERAAVQRALKITALDWEPYTGSSMVHGGNAIQHLRTILGQCNIDLQVEFYPWRRAQQIAHQPGYLGFFPAWPIEVGDGFVSSGEVTPSHLALMAMADSDVQVDEIDEDLPATVSVLLKATSIRSDFNHCCSVFLTALTVEPAVSCHC